jgi:hypothetical protein
MVQTWLDVVWCTLVVLRVGYVKTARFVVPWWCRWMVYIQTNVKVARRALTTTVHLAAWKLLY